MLQETHFRPEDTQTERSWKKIFHEYGHEDTGIAIFISNKIDFKDCNKRQRRIFHNDKGINPRRCNNSNYTCTQYMSTYIHKTNINRYKGRN